MTRLIRIVTPRQDYSTGESSRHFSEADEALIIALAAECGITPGAWIEEAVSVVLADHRRNKHNCALPPNERESHRTLVEEEES